MAPFTKYLWIELIGFDNRQADYGVAEYLSRMPVKPEVICILLWSSNIIHVHCGLEEDAPIGINQCAYWVRPRNEEHEIQNWTRFQLRGLIQELHKHGVKAYASFFDQIMIKERKIQMGLADLDEWIDHHQEIRYVNCFGGLDEICIWKHISDGTLYEDFFVHQLEAFLCDYGFDGLHGADGYGHPRENIAHGDFSDDMVGQFTEATNVTIPEGMTLPERAQWILNNVRKEWTDFHTRRHAQFWKKVITMLNSHNLGHILNNCWTRDPLEARIRNGLDYNLLAEAGVRNFICEAQAAALETEGWNFTDIPKQDDFRATVQRMKSCLPQCNFLLLHCVKDGLEQYDALHHVPMFMESDIYTLANVIHDKGRVLDGITVCLADGILKSEWEMFDSLYSKAFGPQIRKLLYPRVVWSDEAHKKECEAYEWGKSFLNSHLLHANLLSQGAVLPASVRVDELPENGAGPLLILHPGFYSEEEKARVFAAADGNVAEAGYDGQQDSFVFRLYEGGKECVCFRGELNPAVMPKDVWSWLIDLPERKPAKNYFAEAAEALNKHFSQMRPVRDNDLVRLWGYEAEDGLIHLFVGSEKRTYNTALIRLKGDYDFEQLLSGRFVMPPKMTSIDGETEITVKLPPSGTVHMALKRK